MRLLVWVGASVSRVLAAGLVAVLAFATTWSAFAQPVEVPMQPGPTYQLYKSSRALIISAAKYKYPQSWTGLPHAESDANKLAAYLGTHGFSEITRIEDKPGAEVREAIRQFLLSAPKGSRNIVYFAGHGTTDPDDKRVGYIVPSDAPDIKADLVGFRQSAISTRDIRLFTEMAAGQHTLFIIDSCMSGAMLPSEGGFSTYVPGAFPPKPLFWETLALPRFQILTASDNTSTIPAKSKLVDRIIEGLEGAVDSPGYGFTTAYNLSLWLRAKALDDDDGTNLMFGSIGIFNPAANANYNPGGDMVFLTGGKPTTVQPIKANHRSKKSQYPQIVPVQLLRIQDGIRQGPPPIRYSSSYLGDFDPSKIFNGLIVEYYKKVGDGVRVTRAMDRLGVPYQAKPAQIRYDVTNAIACHADIPVEAFKGLVIGLIDEGVEIRLIKQFGAAPDDVSVSSKMSPEVNVQANTIQILSAFGGAFETARPISAEQVKSMNGCPKWYQN